MPTSSSNAMGKAGPGGIDNLLFNILGEESNADDEDEAMMRLEKMGLIPAKRKTYAAARSGETGKGASKAGLETMQTFNPNNRLIEALLRSLVTRGAI